MTNIIIVPSLRAVVAEPPLAYRMLVAMGRDMYSEGRPYSECLTTPEREGYREAQAKGQPCTN